MISAQTNFVSSKRLALGPWPAFERCIARFLEHGGFTDVKVVGGTGDQGADVLARKGHELWVIQAKYRNSGKVPKSAIEEALNAMREYCANVCVTVTNQFFSREAIEFNNKKMDLGFKSHLWNRDDFLKFGETLPLVSQNRRTPRDYQKEAISEITNAMNKGKSRGLLTLATGLGKTMIASTFISNFIEDNPSSNVLVLAHMSDLVKQLDRSCWPQFNSEISTHVWTDGEKPSFFTGVVFATWQSVLNAMDNGEIKEDYFDLIIVDECHHAPSRSFSRLLNDLKPFFMLGVTATPWRTDNSTLRNLFGNPLFSMSVVEGMQKGFLSKVDYEMFTDNIDWEEIRDLSKKGLTIKDLNQKLYIPERDRGMVEQIVSIIKSTENPRVLVFCRSIPHSERLFSFFKMYDIKTSILHNKLTKTEKFNALSKFRDGRLTVLISIEMLNEGIDVPEVNIVSFARVTHSRRIFLQQLGRGLRISENKKFVKVLDFVADIRRVAAGIEINSEASKIKEVEIVPYPNGNIVKFSNDTTKFFDQYLNDMSDISNLDDSSRLEFPE
ncbi:MAG: DEAD/DEAH box helicase family protein [Prochlorococcus marinus XMU1428]|nr:DEAD/DEAH box helicase family protein [Prochlorococcus marinus XMU1428]